MLTEKNMLTTPARPSSLSRNQSFENPPCPPYNLSQEDVFSQAPIVEEDDLWCELERIQDPGVLKEKFYAEHQLMREQLNLAGRFGLELQQSLEQAQRAERQSYVQLQALQDENMVLQTRVHHSQELSAHLTGTEDEVQNLTSENESLQKELDGCRRELKMFRKELDGLVEQMADMGTEVMDAKTKVSVYSRRLNDVEQELNSTQELNVNLQEQLRVALERQKQTQSSTAQVVKIMQTELGKVVSDSGTIRSTLEELENRQEKCEDKVVEMISNTKEYAQLLEEAQSTIQTMRIESDMDGRGWSPSSSSWDNQLRRSTGQLSTLAMEDPELNNPGFPSEELDPQAWGGEQAPGMSLGMELSLGTSLDKENGTQDRAEPEDQPKESISTPALDQPATSSPKQLMPAPSPQMPPVVVYNKETQTPVPAPQQQQQPTPSIPKDARKFSTHSLSSELQQRLEEHNILQNVFSGATSLSSPRPPWNPSVALENILPTPTRNRSRSTSRAPSTSSRSSSRSVSQASLHHLSTSSPATSTFRTGRASMNVMPSPQISPHMISPSSTSSLMDAIAAHSGKRRSGSASTSGINTSGSNTINSSSRPRSRTTAATVEKNPTPGLKYLLSTSGSSTELSNVITKTKANKAGSVSSVTSSSAANRTPRNVASNNSAAFKTSADNTNNKAKVKVGPASNNSINTSVNNNNNKTMNRAGSLTVEGGGATPRNHASAVRPPPSPSRNVAKKISSPSLSTMTTGTGRTTPRSHPVSVSASASDSVSPSPRADSSASMSSPCLSPVPSSPSSASKKLKAMAMAESGTESSVTSMPLLLPVLEPATVAVETLEVSSAPLPVESQF